MKKKLAIILALLIGVVSLVGCDFSGYKDYANTSGFVQIVGYEDLYYYPSTSTIYIIFNEAIGYSGYGYAMPYIQNGHFCEYRNGQIVEVE